MQSTVYTHIAAQVVLPCMQWPLWHVGDVIRKLREDRDWKQEVLSEKAVLNKATIVRVEAGKDSKTPTIKKIAAALGLSVADLYAMVPIGKDPPMSQRSPRPAESFRETQYTGPDERRENLGPPPGLSEERGRGRRQA